MISIRKLTKEENNKQARYSYRAYLQREEEIPTFTCVTACIPLEKPNNYKFFLKRCRFGGETGDLYLYKHIEATNLYGEYDIIDSESYTCKRHIYKIILLEVRAVISKFVLFILDKLMEVR